MYVCMYVRMNRQMDACVCVCMYICMYICILFYLLPGKNSLSGNEGEQLLHLLREVAFASTQQHYQVALDALLSSNAFKDHPRVQRYLTTKWLGCTTVS